MQTQALVLVFERVDSYSEATRKKLTQNLAKVQKSVAKTNKISKMAKNR